MFLQPDWFDVMQPGVGTNRFSYSFNDPINKADQNGNQTVGSFSNNDFLSLFWASFTSSSGSKASSAQASETASALGNYTADATGLSLIFEMSPYGGVQNIVEGVQNGNALQVAGGVVSIAPFGGALKGGSKAVDAASSVWKLAPIARGNAIEKMVGANLPRSFPVVDKLKDGIVTSIKSVDLNAPSYQTGKALESRLTGYVEKVIGFNKGSREGTRLVQGKQFSGKALELAIPGAPNAAQQQALSRTIDFGRLNGVDVYTTIIP